MIIQPMRIYLNTVTMTIEYLRSFKIGQYAVLDIAVSFLGIYIISPLLSKLFRVFKIEIPKISWLYFTLPIGIIFHLIFGQITPMTQYILDFKNNIPLTIFILVLFILGIKNIKIIKK